MGTVPTQRAASGNGSDLPEARVIFSLARLPIAFTAGPEHIVRYVNAALCSLLGKTREQLIGGSCTDILPKSGNCHALLDRVYKTGTSESHTEQEEEDDHPGYWSYEVWPVPAQQKSAAGVMILVTETTVFQRQVTAANEALLLSSVHQHEAAETLSTQLEVETKERRATEEVLLRSEKLATAGRMAASLSHEINNPLAAVVNTLYLALNTPDLPEPARRYLEIADGEVKRIAHITRQALGFYRESSAATLNSVTELLNSVVDLLQSKIRAKMATVEIQYRGDLQWTGISGELRQVLANMLLNSLDAIDDEGTVKLRASVSAPKDGQRRIRITIADNGVGIGADEKEQLFEPFFTTKGAIGTGLGLWVSQQLVKRQGGSIRVHSCTSGPNRGTTFSLLLPGGAAAMAVVKE